MDNKLVVKYGIGFGITNDIDSVELIWQEKVIETVGAGRDFLHKTVDGLCDAAEEFYATEKVNPS